MKLFLLLSILIFAFTQKSLAALSCQSLLEKPTAKQALDRDLLKKYKFKLTAENLLIDMTDRQVIGRIEVLTPSHLYEWAPLDYQQAWVQNGGIFADEMKYILAQPSQAYGKGYYVSTNPFDSTSYGDGLTIFKTSGPLVRIQLEREQMITKAQKVDFLLRLSRAGIDALGNHPTWLSMISTRHLKIETKTVSDPIWKDPASVQSIIQNIKKLIQSKTPDIVKNLPHDENAIADFISAYIDQYQALNAQQFFQLKNSMQFLDQSLKDIFFARLKLKQDELLQSANATQLNDLFQMTLEMQDAEMATDLVKRNVNLDLRSRAGKSILHVAAMKGNLELIKILIRKKIDLNQTTSDKISTALMFAASEGFLDVVKALVKAGADMNLKNNDNRTALYYADTSSGAQKRDVIAFLQSKGAVR